MKFHVFGFTIFTLIFSAVLADKAYCENQVKDFPEYHCRLTLPSSAWKWDNTFEVPNMLMLANASTEDGIILLLGVSKIKYEYAICDSFIAGVEKGQLSQPGVSKTGSRKLTYCNVPCYQLESFSSEINTHTINRCFNGHGYSFGLVILYPKEYTGEVSALEQIFDSFVFTSPPVVKLRPENKAYEDGQWIGNIAGHIIFYTILGYIAFAIIKKVFGKKPKETKESDIVRRQINNQS
jgi:hypothetical protein